MNNNLINPMMNNVPMQRNQFASYFNPTSTGASASTNNIVWVQGIEGAKAWQLTPNSMVILLDSEAEGKMYIKVSIPLFSFGYFLLIKRRTKNNNKQKADSNR